MYQLTVLNILLFLGPEIFGYANGSNLGEDAAPTEHYTSIFNCFVIMQLFNQFNSRKIHHEMKIFDGLVSQGKFFLFIAILEFGAQVLLVEFGGTWFSTKPLTWVSWVLAIVLGLLVFPVQYLIIFFASLSRRMCHRRSQAALGAPVVADMGVQVTARLAKGHSHESITSSNGLGDQMVAATLVKTKRHETSNSIAGALTRQGEEHNKKELTRAGIEYQRHRRHSLRQA